MSTTETQTREQVLLSAADLLEERGWTRYVLVNYGGQLCIRGALLVALGEDPEVGWDVHPLEESIFGVDPMGHDRPAKWNNNLPDGSGPVVVEALRRLADGATWEEATS